MKKIITLIAIVTTMFVACEKKSSAPANTAITSTPAPTVTTHCIYSGTVFLECCTGTQQDAMNRNMWYRDHGYTSVTSVQKSSCSQCQ